MMFGCCEISNRFPNVKLWISKQRICIMCVFKLSLETFWVGVGVGSPTDKPINPAGEKTHKDKKKHKKHKKHKKEHDSDAHEDVEQATIATQSTTPHPF